MKSNKVKNKPEEPKYSISGIILCAGSGTRSGLGYNKMLYYIGKKTILEMTVDRFMASRVQSVMIVAPQNDLSVITELLEDYKNVHICVGGDTRTESVRAGLNEIGHCDIVVIHDGARPFITPQIIDKSIESVIAYGSGVVAVPTVDTIKEISNNEVVRTLSRSGLFNIQTPQSFDYNKITDAYNKVPGNYNDDSEVFERAGYIPKIVVGDYDNIKVTTVHDLFKVSATRSKIGVGFDVHQLVQGWPLILGGIVIPHNKGLKGHSDADVLVHAIMDSLLSAAGLPDIGVLFPNTDDRFKGANSMNLLSNVFTTITARGFKIGNISAVIMAEKPRLTPYVDKMRENIANTLLLAAEQINISTTTTENLGIIGEEKGIAASSTCMLFY